MSSATGSDINFAGISFDTVSNQQDYLYILVLVLHFPLNLRQKSGCAPFVWQLLRCYCYDDIHVGGGDCEHRRCSDDGLLLVLPMDSVYMRRNNGAMTTWTLRSPSYQSVPPSLSGMHYNRRPILL